MNEKNNITALTPLILRIGMGLVFVIGGLNKLSKLLNPDTQEKIIASYWGTHGYVNQFFIDFFAFGNGGISEWWFLTSLSTFELFSGIALIIGLAIRPLSLIYGFLLWTFVIALPSVTVPGIEVSVRTFTAPAIFVQIRDIALSGMMFVLYNLGSGKHSLDEKYFNCPALKDNLNWDSLGLLLRLSLAIPLGVAAIFFGMANIVTFHSSAWILLPLAILLAGGSVCMRYVGTALALVMTWYIITKLNMDKSIISNLNGFKREFAFIAGGIVLTIFGGGNTYTVLNAVNRIKLFFNK